MTEPTELAFLRILIVEDDPDDAALLQLALVKGGIGTEFRVVDRLDDARAALETAEWDVVVTDHALPGFSSRDVLELKLGLGLDLPCIVLSGAIGEEVAVDLLKSGVADVISKTKLARAPLAIGRAFREVQLERERRRAHEELESLVGERTEALRESEERWRRLVDGHPEPIMISVDARIRYLNAAAATTYGASSPGELIGRSLLEFVEPEHREELATRRARVASGHATEPWEHRTRGLDGRVRTVVAMSVPVAFEGERAAQTVFRDVTEQRRMELYVREAQRKMSEAREHERLALARELHDGVLQQLLGLRMRTASFARRFPDGADAKDFREISDELLRAGRELRALVRDLRPHGLAELGLVRTLESYLGTVREERAGVSIEATLPDERVTVPESVGLSALRIVQESVRNALRHGLAGRVEVGVWIGEDTVRIRVRDDGRGFEVPDALTAFAREQHFGLLGMLEHAEMHDGRLDVRSGLGEGTTVEVTLPYRAAVGPVDGQRAGGLVQ